MKTVIQQEIKINEHLMRRVRRRIQQRNPSFYQFRNSMHAFRTRYNWVMHNLSSNETVNEFKLLRELLRRAVISNTTQFDVSVFDSKIHELTLLLGAGFCVLKSFPFISKGCRLKYFESEKTYEYERRIGVDGGEYFRIFISPDWYETFYPEDMKQCFVKRNPDVF